WPQLALVQMAVGEEILLIDPLIPGMTDALRPWLTDPTIVKVMHSASEDLLALKCACDALPRPLFDTQTGAAIAGFGGGMGYGQPGAGIAPVRLPKAEVRAGWWGRPLSAAQRESAADGVEYLAARHDSIQPRLRDQDRLAWWQDECERMAAT